jgi:hypothetical protein
MGVFTSCTLEYKVQEIIFCVQELNKILHKLKRYELLCPKFISGLHMEKLEKNHIKQFFLISDT